MAIIAVEQNQKVKSFDDINRDAFAQYVLKELRFPLYYPNPASLHRALNQLFGDGTVVIPPGYYNDNGENDFIIPVRYGRCRDELIETATGVKHHFINTFILPDGKVHVVIINTHYEIEHDE